MVHMCGIVGYIGDRKAVPIILEGLRRLEYRGYDSAGLAVYCDDRLEVRRAQGKLRNLEEAIRMSPLDGSCGIGHTRWATHGRPTEENAHPHRDCHGDVVVVHNGIVENYLPLKQRLQSEGHVFKTETDTEVIAHLIEEASARATWRTPCAAAVKEISGVFALAAISRSDPNKIVAARFGPPVVIGIGDNEYFVASDVPAILNHTRDMFFLADGDMAVLTPDGVRLSDFDGRPVNRQVSHILWDPIMAEKGGYKHFMLKEIFEQPRAVRDTTLGRVGQETGRIFLDEMDIRPEDLAALPPGQDRRLRNQLARRARRQVHDRTSGAAPRGSRLRQRVPLSRSHRARRMPDRSGFAIRRNRRHAWPRNAKPSARARRLWPSATSRAP